MSSRRRIASPDFGLFRIEVSPIIVEQKIAGPKTRIGYWRSNDRRKKDKANDEHRRKPASSYGERQ
jgi:hypothetical protein